MGKKSTVSATPGLGVATRASTAKGSTIAASRIGQSTKNVSPRVSSRRRVRSPPVEEDGDTDNFFFGSNSAFGGEPGYHKESPPVRKKQARAQVRPSRKFDPLFPGVSKDPASVRKNRNKRDRRTKVGQDEPALYPQDELSGQQNAAQQNFEPLF